MLNERPGRGHADAEQPPDDDFENREDQHRQDGGCGGGILDRRERADHLVRAPGDCCFLNSSRALVARSKISAGTISPRIVLASASASARHSGPLAFVMVRPRLAISAIAAWSCFGTSTCSRFSTAAADASSFARSFSGILFHAFVVITLPPTT